MIRADLRCLTCTCCIRNQKEVSFLSAWGHLIIICQKSLIRSFKVSFRICDPLQGLTHFLSYLTAATLSTYAKSVKGDDDLSLQANLKPAIASSFTAEPVVAVDTSMIAIAVNTNVRILTAQSSFLVLFLIIKSACMHACSLLYLISTDTCARYFLTIKKIILSN